MTNFTRYPSYKDSGVEWLGKIPEHWQMKKVKFLAKIQKIKSFDKNPVILSLARDKIKVRDISTGEGQIAATYDGYHRVQIGDFLLNPMDLYSGANCNISYVNGVISPAYTNLKFNQKINAKFADFFFKIMYENLFLKSLGKGVSDENRWTLNNETLMNIKLPLPPKDEQTKIASFLDEKTTQINQAIAQKERLVELLKEKKQITINDAVTKGLDKNTPLKDSGVEWLGKIPAHWEASKLGTILKPISIKNRSDLPLLSVTREQGVILRDVDDKESNHNFIPDDLSSYKVVEKGQFAMNKMKAWQGSYGVSGYTGIVSPAYYIFELNGIESTFFHHAIRSSVYVPFFIKASDGVRIGQWDLSKSRMKEIPFYIPPTKEEQIQIVEYLQNQTTQIDKAIQLQQNYIAKLKEYKASLIDSVVRGKVRVG